MCSEKEFTKEHTFAWGAAGFLAACFAFLASFAALTDHRKIVKKGAVGQSNNINSCKLWPTIYLHPLRMQVNACIVLYWPHTDKSSRILGILKLVLV